MRPQPKQGDGGDRKGREHHEGDEPILHPAARGCLSCAGLVDPAIAVPKAHAITTPFGGPAGSRELRGFAAPPRGGGALSWVLGGRGRVTEVGPRAGSCARCPFWG